jgi:hypothetical protein
MKLYTLNQNNHQIVDVSHLDDYALVHLKNGQKRKIEVTIGQGFLTQSTPRLVMNKSVDYIEIVDKKGKSRRIKNEIK